MKRKLLLAAVSLTACLSSAFADDVYKDVTSVYLTNTDFEGTYEVYKYPNSNKDRAIYCPQGWNIEYKDGREWDMTILKSSDLASNSFNGKISALADGKGGEQTYQIRFNNSYKGQSLGLYQTKRLQLGEYKLTADYYKGGSGGDALIVVDDKQQNSANNDKWSVVSVDFSSDGLTDTKMGCLAVHTNTYEKFYAFDNFKLEMNLTQSLNSLIGKATEAYDPSNESSSMINLKNCLEAAETGKESQETDVLEELYNNLSLALGALMNANEEDYKNLQEAIDKAEENALGFDEGEYAPYNNIEAIKALAAAKAINQSADNAKEDVNAAKDALENATWTVNETEVNAVYNGDFANSTPNPTSGVDVDVPGWTYVTGMRMVVGDATVDKSLVQTNAGKALFTWGGTTSVYGESADYTMPLAAHTVYELSFKYAGWRDGDMGYITATVKKQNGDNVSSSNTSNMTKRINTENAFETYTVKFTTGEEGNYELKLWASKHAAFTDISIRKAAEANMTITEAGWATFIAPFDVEIPAGVTAYTVEGVKVDNYLNKAAIETGVIPANTPVLLKGEEGLTYTDGKFTQTFYGLSTATQDTYGEVLVGNVSGKTMNVSAGSYVLLNQNDKLGFYQVEFDTDNVTVGNNRCYLNLNVPAGSEIKAFFFDDEATGINGVETLTDGAVESIYTINGTRVNSLQKGLNIVKMSNGKTQKVLVK